MNVHLVGMRRIPDMLPRAQMRVVVREMRMGELRKRMMVESGVDALGGV